MSAAARRIRTIVVPLDGSEFAEQALPTACAIAGESGARLRLVLVHEPPTLPLDPASASLYSSTEICIRKGERAYLEKIRARLGQDGRAVTATVSGPVAPTLIEYAHDVEADLIVMATHGRGPLQRLWLGSIADAMLRSSDIPVLVVRPAQEGGSGAPAHSIERILVPLDGSQLAEQALQPATTLARACGAEVDLVQVVQPVLLSVDPLLPLPSSHDQELTALARDRAQDYLQDIAERYRERGVNVSAAACVGWDPVETLLELARPPRCDLLVLATHGRGGVRRLAIGSVADKLVRAADVPVLVCRPVKRRGSVRRRRAIALL
jgi:nucleotide-binding universal stress UspA family protein